MNDTEITRQLTTFEELVKHLATKEDIATTHTKIEQVRADMLERLLDMQARMYQMIFGTYALIVAGVFINHFWR